MTASETALFDRVRKSDTCPPSLLKEGGFGEGDDGFAAAVLAVLDGATGTFHAAAASLETGGPPFMRYGSYPNAIPDPFFSTSSSSSIFSQVLLYDPMPRPATSSIRPSRCVNCDFLVLRGMLVKGRRVFLCLLLCSFGLDDSTCTLARYYG